MTMQQLRYIVEVYKCGSITEDGMKFLQFAHRVLDASDDIYEYFSQDQPKEKDIYLSVSSQHCMFPVGALIRFMQRKAGAAGYVARIREVKTLQVVQDVLVQDS